jgi:DNA-binding YbaB/EbfC family protein
MADFLGMMKQAAQLKSRMEALQAEMDRIEVEGQAGNGMVAVRLSAKGDMRGITIDASLMKADEKDMLEDLVIAAHADAKRKAEAVMQEKMKDMTGGMSIPGLT